MLLFPFFLCILLFPQSNHAFLKGASRCEQNETISLKQCFFKFMEEIYEDINDLVQPMAFKELLFRLIREDSECKRFWNMAMCLKFVDACYDHIWMKEERALVNAAFAYKYSICSGFDTQQALNIIKCLDIYERHHLCEGKMQMFKDVTSCTSQGHKVYKCLSSKKALELCTDISDIQRTVVCQLYTFRRVTPCLQNNCAIKYLDNDEDTNFEEKLEF